MVIVIGVWLMVYGGWINVFLYIGMLTGDR